jgi:hypothetical protein
MRKSVRDAEGRNPTLQAYPLLVESGPTLCDTQQKGADLSTDAPLKER